MKKVSFGLMAGLMAVYVSVGTVRAQAPQAVPYQAVVRNASGNAIANKTVGLRFSVRDAAATVVYQERQAAITNALGLFSVNVGQGTVATGSFSGIDWAGNTKFLQVEVDTTGGTTYISMGTQQLLSVPYALNAKKADSAKVASSAITAINGVPPGTMVPFAGPANNVPSGWMICWGQSVSRTDPTYVALYNAIGTAWGTSDSNSFNLPFTAGMFLRGQAKGQTFDPDRNSRSAIKVGGNSGDKVGSFQQSAFQGHWHNIYFADANVAPGAGWGNVTENAPKANGPTSGGTPVKEATTDGVNGVPSTSSETRPINVNVNYIIKL